jgi:hypothetical protein
MAGVGVAMIISAHPDTAQQRASRQHQQSSRRQESVERRQRLELVNPPVIETVIEDSEFLHMREARREQRDVEDAERQRESRRNSV